MVSGREYGPRETPVLDPGRVEELDAVALVREHDPSAVPVKPAIDKRSRRRPTGRAGEWRPVEDEPVHEPVAHARELHEAPRPEGLVFECLGVEARGELAVLSQADADPLGD